MPPNLSDERLVNGISQLSHIDELDRERLLEAPNPLARADALIAVLEKVSGRRTLNPLHSAAPEWHGSRPPTGDARTLRVLDLPSPTMRPSVEASVAVSSSNPPCDFAVRRLERDRRVAVRRQHPVEVRAARRAA